MAISELRNEINSLQTMVENKYNAVKDSDEMKLIRSLADLIGSFLKGLGIKCEEGIGRFDKYVTNTTNFINDQTNMFDNMLEELSPKSVNSKIEDFKKSLTRDLEFNINANMASASAVVNDPISAILKSVKSTCTKFAIWNDTKDQLVKNIVANKVDTALRKMNVTSSLRDIINQDAIKLLDKTNNKISSSLLERVSLYELAASQTLTDSLSVIKDNTSTISKALNGTLTTPINTKTSSTIKTASDNLIAANSVINKFVVSTITSSLLPCGEVVAFDTIKKGIDNNVFTLDETLDGVIDSIENSNSNDKLDTKLYILDELRKELCIDTSSVTSQSTTTSSSTDSSGVISGSTSGGSSTASQSSTSSGDSSGTISGSTSGGSSTASQSSSSSGDSSGTISGSTSSSSSLSPSTSSSSSSSSSSSDSSGTSSNDNNSTSFNAGYDSWFYNSNVNKDTTKNNSSLLTNSYVSSNVIPSQVSEQLGTINNTTSASNNRTTLNIKPEYLLKTIDSNAIYDNIVSDTNYINSLDGDTYTKILNRLSSLDPTFSLEKAISKNDSMVFEKNIKAITASLPNKVAINSSIGLDNDTGEYNDMENTIVKVTTTETPALKSLLTNMTKTIDSTLVSSNNNNYSNITDSSSNASNSTTSFNMSESNTVISSNKQLNKYNKKSNKAKSITNYSYNNMATKLTNNNNILNNTNNEFNIIISTNSSNDKNYIYDIVANSLHKSSDNIITYNELLNNNNVTSNTKSNVVITVNSLTTSSDNEVKTNTTKETVIKRLNGLKNLNGKIQAMI